MWPKVLAQLIDLLPHARRLMPLAENFFQNRGAAATMDAETRKAMDDLRDGLAKSAATHEALYRQINQQSEAMADAAADARATKAAVTALEARLEAIERRQKAVAATSIVTIAGIIVLLALMAWVLVRLR